MIKNYLSSNQPSDTIFDTDWQTIAIYRTVDDASNVGVDTELDARTHYKLAKARLDPLDNPLDADRWLGTMQQLDVRVNDIWTTQAPDSQEQSFKVISIRENDIILERM